MGQGGLDESTDSLTKSESSTTTLVVPTYTLLPSNQSNTTKGGSVVAVVRVRPGSQAALMLASTHIRQ
eukprot:scaffold254405_cov17-Prasinocladus_malaysianus.AAC.1